MDVVGNSDRPGPRRTPGSGRPARPASSPPARPASAPPAPHATPPALPASPPALPASAPPASARPAARGLLRGRLPQRPVRRVSQLFAGLVLYGISMAFLVESSLGLDPWDVFHQGLSETSGISFGWVVILLGIPILLLWIPLRQRPGFGTVANLIVIGLVVDAALAVLPTAVSWPARIALLVGGIVLNAVASGMYIGSRFGPGPRDGLMTGLVSRFPRLSIRLVRTAIEVTVLAAGFLLGGTVGIGTVAYALMIGPLVHIFLPMFTVPGAESPGSRRTEAAPVH